MGEQGGPERLTARQRAQDFQDEAWAYVQKHVGLTFRSCDSDVSGFVTRKYHQTELGPLPIDSPAVEIVWKLHYDGDTAFEKYLPQSKLMTAHSVELFVLAASHNGSFGPSRFEPEKPADGEPFTMILTFHFTEGE